ncbi:MAG: CidA/LrgA family protein [Alphaproteobacteria bacterium]|jgi:holin-like protein|nr:CidA/LrgA family protein [Alphaproteobacteria bacterium]
MLGFFVVVLALLWVGELVAAAVVPILPGPLVGMVLLLAVFVARGGVPASFEGPATGLVAHLTLFILPASLAILEEYGRLAEAWLLYAAVLLGSSLVTAVVAALVAGGLLHARPPAAPRRRRPRPPTAE